MGLAESQPYKEPVSVYGVSWNRFADIQDITEGSCQLKGRI